MLVLNIDSNKNILFVNFLGTVSEKDIVDGISKAGILLKELKDNFILIMNLTEFIPSSAEQCAIFNKIIKSINDKIKINLIIRIVGESKSLIQNLCKMDKLFNFNNVKYVPTLEDAERLIDTQQ
jgi:hypothetical protein